MEQKFYPYIVKKVLSENYGNIVYLAKNKDSDDKYIIKSFEKENVKLTFTPIFVEAAVKALKDYPLINVSVDQDKIIKKKNIKNGFFMIKNSIDMTLISFKCSTKS